MVVSFSRVEVGKKNGHGNEWNFYGVGVGDGWKEEMIYRQVGLPCIDR